MNLPFQCSRVNERGRDRYQLSTPNVISNLQLLVQYLFAITIFTNHTENEYIDVTEQFFYSTAMILTNCPASSLVFSPHRPSEYQVPSK